MPKPVVTFPDSVLVTIEYLRSVVPGVPVYPRVPVQRPQEFIRIERLGGTRRSLVTDRPRINVECWSHTEESAEALMNTARAYALAMAGKRGDTTVYHVSEVGGPQWLPDSESGQPRYAFAVEFSIRGTEMS